MEPSGGVVRRRSRPSGVSARARLKVDDLSGLVVEGQLLAGRAFLGHDQQLALLGRKGLPRLHRAARQRLAEKQERGTPDNENADRRNDGARDDQAMGLPLDRRNRSHSNSTWSRSLRQYSGNST